MIATFGSHTIAQISNVTFNGSSSPSVDLFPRCKGGLVLPSSDAERTISLLCQYFIAGKSKTQMESYHHNLCEQLALTDTDTLIVNGNAYEGVFVTANSQEILTHADYLAYSIDFRIPSSGTLKNALINTDRKRSGYFEYKYRKLNTEETTFSFQIYSNYEASTSVAFNEQSKPREIFKYGKQREQVGGIETISLNCWLVESPTKEIESYMYNWLCGYGPLGKQGTLNLNGNIYYNAVLTSVSQPKIIGNTNAAGEGASSVSYTLEFQVSVQC